MPQAFALDAPEARARRTPRSGVPYIADCSATLDMPVVVAYGRTEMAAPWKKAGHIGFGHIVEKRDRRMPAVPRAQIAQVRGVVPASSCRRSTSGRQAAVQPAIERLRSRSRAACCCRSGRTPRSHAAAWTPDLRGGAPGVPSGRYRTRARAVPIRQQHRVLGPGNADHVARGTQGRSQQVLRPSPAGQRGQRSDRDPWRRSCCAGSRACGRRPSARAPARSAPTKRLSLRFPVDVRCI